MGPMTCERTAVPQGGAWPEYASSMVLCFSSWEHGVACGELWSFCFQKPRRFCGLDQLLFTVEAMLDEIGRSPPAWQMRTLTDKPRRRGAAGAQKPAPSPDRPPPYYGPDGLTCKRGRLCTAVVRVQYRQNASMQGRLLVYPARRPVSFRSALELLHLLRDALEQCVPPENNTKKERL